MRALHFPIIDWSSKLVEIIWLLKPNEPVGRLEETSQNCSPQQFTEIPRTNKYHSLSKKKT